MALFDIDGSKLASEVRVQISGFLANLGDCFLGPTAPGSPFLFMRWGDNSGTNTIALKVYDGAGWVLLWTLNTSTGTVTYPITIPTVPNASTTVKGLIEVATNDETKTGTATLLAISPSRLRSMRATQTEAETGTLDNVWMSALQTKQAIAAQTSGGAFTESYESAQISIVNNSIATLAHGLTSAPKLVAVHAVCTSAIHDYVVGDEIVVTGIANANQVSDNHAHTAQSDSTNVYLIMGTTGNGWYLTKSTRGSAVLSSSNWKYIVRAWA